MKLLKAPNAILKSNQKHNKNMNNAIIATRFSNAKQIGNTSTEVQLDKCISYCSLNNLTVVGTKSWEAESADTGNVKRLMELIAFCKQYQHQADTLVVFKIDRFARDISEHYFMIREIEKLGFKIRSATEPIDETPTGELMEGILATMAQFDNAVRKQRVKLAMENRLENGIYPWKVPTGYINQQDKDGRATVSIKDNICFNDIKNVFKKFLTKNYTINSLSQELENKKVYDHKSKRIRFYPQFIQKILNTKFYAGILSAPEWCKKREYEGKHEPMITLAEYNKCQEILNTGKLKGIKHVGENKEFPVRDRLYCGICNSKMTAAFCGHKENKTPLYYCHNPNCSITKKSVLKKNLEKEFQDFISTIKIKEEYIKILEKKLIEKYEARKLEFEDSSVKTIKVLEELNSKKQKIMELMENGSYDENDGKDRLKKIKNEIEEAKLNLTGDIGEEFKIEYLIEHGKKILLTLKDFWDSADYSIKLKIQRKFFPEKIIYSFPGFSNTKLSPFLEYLTIIATDNNVLLPRMDSNHSKQLQRLLSYH